MRKNIIIALGIELCLVIGALLMFVRWDGSDSRDFQYVRREEVYRLLSFTYYSEEEWEEMLSDELSKRLTRQDLQFILEKLGLDEYISCDSVSGKVKREEFYTVYDQILDILDVEKAVTRESVLFLETGGSEDLIPTSLGQKTVGYAANYITQLETYDVYIYDGNIIGIGGKSQEETVLSNVYITESTGTQITFVAGEDSYSCDAKTEEIITGAICDITWKNGKIHNISKKENYIEGRILSYTDSTIEVEGYGVLETESTFRLYRIYDEIKEQSRSQLIIGNMSAKFIVAGDKISACLLFEPENVETIRVLLKGNQSNELHSTFGITCDGAYSIVLSEGETACEAGAVFTPETVSAEELQAGILIRPSEGCKLYFSGMDTFDSSIGYEGTFEIRSYEGGYAIVNELSLEQYLCKVVPSEMPSSFEKEAQKAQAVCARSYAYNCICESGYPQYGAHLDDSTSYQVYNKGAGNETATAAVNETAGQVLMYNGEVLSTYYFSTSCGMTTDGSVWNWSQDVNTDYLKCAAVSVGDEAFDYSTDEAFLNFLQSDTSGYYETDCPYFRWNTTVSIPVGDSFKNAVTQLKQTTEDAVIICDTSGKETTVDKIGKLQSISVTERSMSGCICELTLSCSKGTVTIRTENKIRTFFGNFVTQVTLKDMSSVEVGALLPSAFFVLTNQNVSEGILTGDILGGGYGHGIGMSQNGANEMAKQGSTYVEILNLFYSKVTVENISGNL